MHRVRNQRPVDSDARTGFRGTSDTSHAIPLLTPRLAISAPADSLIFVAQWRRPAPYGAGSQVDLVTVAAAGASAGTNVDCPAGASTSPLNGTPDICASPSTVSDTSSALAEGGSWSIAIAAPSGGATPVPTLALLALVLAAAGALVAHRLAGRWPRAGAGRSPGSPARYPPRVMTIAAEPDRTLVSCLMVTLPSPLRLPFFRRSVADYCRQSHPTRELVVVLDRGDPDARDAMIAHVESLGRDDVRVIEPAEKLTLGALRNVGVAEARGDVVCHWDDDDWFHPERVRAQVAELARAGAQSLVLEDALHYFPVERTLHWTNWRATAPRGLPGTLMFCRSVPVRYPESGPEAAKGEDTAAIAQLQAHGGFRAMPGAPHLYVYVSHGANTWDASHHSMLARELSISQSLLRRREGQLREGVRPFEFGPGEVAVRGYNGVALTLDLASAGEANAPGSSSPR